MSNRRLITLALSPELVLTVVLSMMISSAWALSDPMRPPDQPAYVAGQHKGKQNKRARWRLTATLIGQGRRQATINGRVVSPGDRVNGARVIDIQPAAVTLGDKSGTRVIRLLNTTLDKRRRN